MKTLLPITLGPCTMGVDLKLIIQSIPYDAILT